MNPSAFAARWAVAALLCGCQAATAQDLSIETSGKGGAITVSASADLRVRLDTAWGVISDYDHLADFVPDMRSSRVLQRNGDQLLVQQTGAFGFLFFQQPIDVELAVTESPSERIVAHAVGGNLREMDGRYTLTAPAPGEVRLTYVGRLVPEFAVPPVVGKLVVRNAMARQFSALVKEILRRDAAAANARPPATDAIR
jgi:Polyketide cyclase / dehydrase and lipid transport